MKYDLDKDYILLNSSVRMKKKEFLRGKLGPDTYRSYAADCYQYDFICEGTNSHELDCKILRNNSDVVKVEGNYSIYTVENYSLYIPQDPSKENSLFGMNFGNGKKNNKIIYFSSLIFILFATFIFVYAFITRKGANQLKEINIAENSYIPETTSLK